MILHPLLRKMALVLPDNENHYIVYHVHELYVMTYCNRIVNIAMLRDPIGHKTCQKCYGYFKREQYREKFVEYHFKNVEKEWHARKNILTSHGLLLAIIIVII